MSAFLAFAARHWKWFALGALAISVFIGFRILEIKLSRTEQKLGQATTQLVQSNERLKVSNASIGELQTSINGQNAAIDNLATEGQARIEAGQAELLVEVRRGAKASTVARELTQSPTRDADQSRTSAKVLANKDLL